MSTPADAQAGDHAALSEAEAALYDRQIRLWGADAQKRCGGFLNVAQFQILPVYFPGKIIIIKYLIS